MVGQRDVMVGNGRFASQTYYPTNLLKWVTDWAKSQLGQACTYSAEA